MMREPSSLPRDPKKTLSDPDWKNWGQMPVVSFLNALERQWPEAVCELEFSNDFDCLVAIILSARTTDKKVNEVTRVLFKGGRTPDQAVFLSLKQLELCLRPLGLASQKARYVYALTQIFKQRGDAWETMQQLMTLPGVGRKTAQVFLNLRRGQGTFPVDTHLFRVSRRTGLVAEKDVLSVENGLRQKIPLSCANTFHLRMVLHGRYICKSLGPKCRDCDLSAHCQFFRGCFSSTF